MEGVKEKRLELGLTQTQAADLLGVTHRTWHRWEHGHITPPRPVLLCLDLLCQVQGTTIGTRYGID